MKNKLSLLFTSICCATITVLLSNAAIAQVTTDGTTNTTVNSADNSNFTIDSGDRAGGNLFHSFDSFSVPNGGSAVFNNPIEIENIFSRVTGGNISNIDGLISANGSANLFLINPAGIMFGEGARLDIGGSFYGSSASSILFEDGEFSAVDNLQQPILTINAPIGLGFRDNPGDVVNRSVADDVGLEVRSGQGISLLGGNVNLTGGKITAPDGVVNLGGLIASGEITIDDSSFVFPSQITKGNVALSSQAEVNVRGDRGGAINIDADRLEIIENSIFLAGIETGLGSPEVQADDISINTNTIFASNDSQIRNENLGTGNAGNINITTGTLEFNEGSIIVASTFGRGNAGNININATGDVLFDRDFGGIFSTAGIQSDERQVENVVGNAGDVTVNANSLSLFRGARIVTKTAGEGNAGNVSLNVSETVLIDGVGTTIVPFFLEEFDTSLVIDSAILTQVTQNGIGNGGDIEINAKNVIARNTTQNDLVQNFNRALIAADNQGGIGDSGNIIINATDSVLIDRGLVLTELGETPDSFTNNPTFAEGNGGDIIITTGSLTVKNNSDITSRTEAIGDAGNIIITADDFVLLENGKILGEVLDDAVGNGGNIEINASSLTLTDNSLFNTQTLGQGDAGNITINTTESVSLDNESKIESSVDSGDRNNNNALGNAGNINISTGNLRLNNNSELRNISFARGNAGNITVNATGEVFLDGSSEFRSDINDLSSGEFDAVGNAGTIDITATEVIFNDNSSFQSSTSGQGNAGNIIINAKGNVSFNGNFSGIQSQVRGTGVGEGGSISITAGDSITLSDLSILLANTAGEGRGNAGRITINAGETFSLREGLVLSQIEGEAIGDAGGIDITANTIDINNFSLISTNVQRETSGVAGNINLNGANTIISEGAIVDALTENNFDGGNINFSGGNLAIVSGGAVATSTDSTGNAGNITLDLTGDITIDGTGTIPRPEEVFQLSEQALIDLQESTGLFATSSADSTGNGGNIQSNNSGNLTISNNGIVSVGSEGGGDGGILTINTDSLDLNNQGEITAITTSGSGGIINLVVDDRINLRNNALISAEAFEQANGGNINIDTDFIVAFPNQVSGNGSDIIANAAEGNGGNITIDAQAVLGILERTAIADNQTNDIDASSEFGLDGNISINTPDTNALEGATELPQNVIETEQTTAQACATGDGVAQNTLTVRGKGGIQPAAGMPLNADSLLGSEPSTQSKQPKIIPISTASGEIIPARGVIVKPNGDIILTPYATDNISAPNSNFTNCS